MEKILVFYQKDDRHLLMNNFDCSIHVDKSDFHVIVGAESVSDFIRNEEIHKNIVKNCGEKFNYLAHNSKVFKEFFQEAAKSLANDDYLQFLSQFDIIQLDYEISSDLERFLEGSKEYLANKKILIPLPVYFTPKRLEEVKQYCEEVRKIIPNAQLVCAPCDTSIRYYVDVQDYYDAYEIRENLINLIRSLNLSPLEEIAYIYDYLKKKKYKKEDEDESWHLSRGVVSVLIGNKIVCTGYAALFKSLVESLGHCYVEIMEVKVCGEDKVTHERVMIYVKDDKYGIDGNYIFDVTFDAKKDEEDNANKYLFFLRTIKEMDKANDETNYERVGLDFLNPSKIEELIENLPDVYTEDEFNRIISKKGIYHNTILVNMHRNPFWIEKKGNKKKNILDIYKFIYESFNKSVDYRVIIELLYNVRKIEYYLDPENVSFTLEDLVQMGKNYLAPSFASYFDLVEHFREAYPERLSIEEVIELFIKDALPNVEEEIERIKVTRKLREYLLKK